MLLLFTITDPYPNASHSNNILAFLYENFYFLPFVCGLFNLLIMFAFTHQRILTAKQALNGSLIDIEPRYVSAGGIGILAKVHQKDSKIGTPIHENFNNNLKSGDFLFLNGAQVTDIKKEEYTWTETVSTYSSYYDEGERYGYGGGPGASQMIGGTSIRIHTTLMHDGITYSGLNFGAKKGDILDVIVQISSSNESVVSVRRSKTLSLTPNKHEEE